MKDFNKNEFNKNEFNKKELEKNKLNEIKIDDLFWRAQKDNGFILSDITAVLSNGEFYGILGPNGAGKTSLIRNIINFIQPTSGNAFYDEKKVSAFSKKEISRKISFLPQNTESNLDFDVETIVAMGREPYREFGKGLNGADLKAIDEALTITDCDKIRKTKFMYLSGGEKQRVMIARIIAQDTPWIILDEPISNLDIRHQIELMNIFDRLRKDKGKTIISIVHDINLANDYCTKILLLKQGRVVAFGEKEKVLTAENLESTFDVPFEFINIPGRTIITPIIA